MGHNFRAHYYKLHDSGPENEVNYEDNSDVIGTGGRHDDNIDDDHTYSFSWSA